MVYLILLAVFILPPAWVHILWVNFPEALFVSGGPRSIGFSDLIQAQISAKNNHANPYGVAPFPAKLRTMVSQSASADDGMRIGDIASVTVAWDDYLYTPTRLLFPTTRLPRTSWRANLEIGPIALTLTAGRWRPAIVVELPYSMIVGVWNGSKIATIDSGRVLVVVVDTGEDELLFPFEIMRWKDRPRQSSAVDELIRLVEQRRGVNVE